MVTGIRLGSGIARRAQGNPVVYDMIQPDSTVDNLRWLAAQTKKWSDEVASFKSQNLPIELIKRAEFGIDVLASASETVRANQCCVIVVKDGFDNLLAVAHYIIMPPNGFINLVVTEPVNLAGSPGASQLRGLGTAMVAAISQRMVRRGVQTVYLHPLDAAAEQFWRNRGFQPCGGGGRLCVESAASIAKLVNGCVVRPDNPSIGEVLCCGTPASVRAYRY